MSPRPLHLSPGTEAFLAERHLATLTTLRPDGSPHVTAVGFTWDPRTGLVRVISSGTARKVAYIRAGGANARVAVCQIDGPRWLTLEGGAVIAGEADRVTEAERRYADRYRPPRPNATRVAIEVTVDRVLGNG